MRRPAQIAVLAALAAAPSGSVRAESLPLTMYSNDQWNPGSSVALDSTLTPGDVVAARFSGGGIVLGIGLHYSGAIAQHLATIKIWDDTGEQVVPGAELHSGDVTLDAFDGVSFVPLPSVLVPFTFRVGLVLRNAPPPSIGFD